MVGIELFPNRSRRETNSYTSPGPTREIPISVRCGIESRKPRTRPSSAQSKRASAGSRGSKLCCTFRLVRSRPSCSPTPRGPSSASRSSARRSGRFTSSSSRSTRRFSRFSSGFWRKFGKGELNSSCRGCGRARTSATITVPN